MGKIIRRSIAILLSITAVMLLVLPALNVNASYTKGDFVLDGGTLVEYLGSDLEVTIPLGVTSIGKDAFSGNNNLLRVYIPDEVTSIDYAAFENCKNLTKVSIGNGVRSIGSSAFSGCTSLTEINVPRYCENIGSGTFAACPSLSNIDVNPRNRHFICLDGVLYSRDGSKMYQYLAGRPYTTYEIPEPVKEIGEFGFYGANMLTNVSIVNGVEEIPEYTFLNCSALTKVDIPGSVKAIRKGAFGGCSNLTELAIPTSTSYIDVDAFTSLEGNKGDVVDSVTGNVLSESNISENSTNTLNNNSDSADVFNTSNSSNDSNTNTTAEANNDTQNDDESSSDEKNKSTENESSNLLENIANNISDAVTNTISDGELGRTTVVGGQAVFLIDPKKMIVKGFDINAAQTEDSISESGNSSAEGEDIKKYSGLPLDVIGNNLGHISIDSDSIDIPDNIDKIGNRVFYNNKNIKNVNLPSSIREIGDFSFARSTVESLSLPDGTEKIGYAAFYNCSSLSDLYIPDSVESIELGALDNSLYLNKWKSVEDGNNFLILGDNILVAYKGISDNVVIPEGVKQIGAGCFEGNTKLKSVTIPQTVKKINEDAFNGCIKLSNVELPNMLESIEDRAFKDTSLKSVVIPDSVKEIGLGAFDTSNTNGGLDVAIFKGTELPNTSFKPTATRLSANDLRTNAFEGTDYAIINKATDINSGSIFDPHTYGFRGQVYSNGETSPDGLNQIELRRCTVEPDATGEVVVDDVVHFGGADYYLSGVKETAFSLYEDPTWEKNSLTSITLNGNKSEALDQLLSNVQMSADALNNTVATSDNYAININDNGLFNGQVTAKLPGNNEKYNLNINRDSNSVSAFNNAFDNRYGTHDGIYMENFSIDMTDRLGQIPIKKMATGKLEITMPIPDTLKESELINVATLDDNGLLDEVPSEINIEENGSKSIRFVASHLSPYAIYTTNGTVNISYNELMEETVSVENGVSLSSNTVNVVTGSLSKRVFRIQVRYIIVFILFLTAVLLFLKKDKRRI